MLWKLILLLTVVPLVELYVLFKIAVWTHFWVTVLIILGTGALGAVIARMQGLMVLRRMQQELSEGKIPAVSILDGVMILVAAALLVTPGLLTDTAGFIRILVLVRPAADRPPARPPWKTTKGPKGSFQGIMEGGQHEGLAES